MKYSEITLGCDPEFELMDESGNRYNPEYVADSNSIPCPDWGREVGIDGMAVEIRPNPSSNPKHLLKNFKLAVERANKRGSSTSLLIPRPLILSISGLGSYLGGHLHIGGRDIHKLAGYQESVKLTNKELITLFDVFLGTKIRCLNSPMRYHHYYGLLGQWRSQIHGIEYRSPSSAIFYNETLAKYSLVIMKRVVYFYSKGAFKDYIPLKAKKKDYVKYLRFTPNQYRTFIREIYHTKVDMQRAYKARKPLAVKIHD